MNDYEIGCQETLHSVMDEILICKNQLQASTETYLGILDDLRSEHGNMHWIDKDKALEYYEAKHSSYEHSLYLVNVLLKNVQDRIIKS